MSASNIADGQVVQIHYTLTNDDGDVLDTSSGGEPLTYLHGADNIVPGLEKQLAGKAVGDKVHAVVAPADGYGDYEEGLTQELPRDAFPGDLDLEPEMQFFGEAEDGRMFPFWIVGVEDDSVVIDMNHPLAGEQLTFDVEIVSIRTASDEEKAHGHAHGPGGHDH